MSLRISGEALVKQAVTGGYLGTPYSRLDCQGFVEEVLKDCGVRKSDGYPYNWRGSNSMWRNFIQWRGTIEECRKKFGCIPKGAFMFLVVHDGGEVEKGYHDSLGNAKHVGLYIGNTNDEYPCMDSQGDRGVDFCKLNVFTHVGLMTMIDYETQPEPKPQDNELVKAVRTLRNPDRSDEDCLEALKTLTKYLKGDNI